MAVNSSSSSSLSPLDPEKTWKHFRIFLEKKEELSTEETPKEIPEGEKYTIVTGGAEGADAYAERLALAYECKVDIRIGPNHPRAKCISPVEVKYVDLLNSQQAALRAS